MTHTILIVVGSLFGAFFLLVLYSLMKASSLASRAEEEMFDCIYPDLHEDD